MPLELSAPTIIIPQEQATAFEIKGFSVSPRGILDVSYAYGNVVGGAFVQSGDELTMHIEGPSFAAFISANPTLYPAIKSALYGLIEAQHGVIGSII
jgi:hypothetical protein